MKRVLSILASSVILLFTVVKSVCAQINLNEPLAKDTSVLIGKLSNGLTYYIKPNTKPANKVELRLVLKAGSILENENQQGLAHFMEHMAFNGLKHYPKNELVDYLQKIGIRFGSDLNANTGWDRTYYILPVPTDNPENLEKGFQIVADWAGEALITDEEVNDERKVILEELRMRNKNAQTRMLKQYFPTMFNSSRYADRLPGGLDSVVINADPERIREYYRDWYRPDLMAVIVVGDITVPKAKTFIEKYFNFLKNPLRERPRTYYNVAPYTTKKTMIVMDPEATNYSIALMYPTHKKVIAKTIGNYRNDIIKNIILQAINRRLREGAQSSNPPYKEARINMEGSIGAISLLDENFEMDINPFDDIQKAVNAAVNVVLSIKQYGLMEQDITLAKNVLLARYQNAYNERNNIYSATFTDTYAKNFMQNEPVIGIENKYSYFKELLPTISLKDVNIEANKILQAPENYFSLITAPANGKIKLPTESELKNIITTAFSQTAKQQTQAFSIVNLLQQQPVPGKIVSEIKEEQLGATTYSLSNGVKVTIKPTNLASDEILLSAVKYGGTGLFGASDKANATFLTTVVSDMGYGQFTPIALSNYLSGINVSLKMSMGKVENDLSGASSVKDLPTLMELLYLELTQPRKDTDLINGWKQKLNATLPLLTGDPQIAFNDSFAKVLYHNDSLTPISVPTQHDIDNINIDRVLEIYKDQFGNADGFHFFFVGNINIDSIKPLIEKYIASLPVKGTTPIYKDNGLRLITGNQTFKFYKGKDQKSMLIDMYYGDIMYDDDIALKANVLAQAMTIHVLDIMREKKQWIYSGNVTAGIQKFPYGAYTIAAQLPCGPENVDNIIEELDREIEGYKQNGISSIDMEKVKKAVIEQYKEGLKENRTWLANLQQILFFGTSMNNFLNFEQRINNITNADIKTTANQLLTGNNFKAASFPESKTEN